MFRGAQTDISVEVAMYLGGCCRLTCSSFLKKFVERKVEEWIEEIKMLSTFAKTLPCAAYIAFTHSLSFRCRVSYRISG